MKVYVDTKDIGTTYSYKEENGKKQYLYSHDKEGFEIKDISDYTKQVKKEVCEEIKDFVSDQLITRGDLGYYDIERILDQIQGE